MDTAILIRRARAGAGLSLRALAGRAGTSHSTLAAYEAGRKAPSLATLERIVRAAGFNLAVELTPARAMDPGDRGRELAQVLELAEQFPARHSPTLEFPVFGR